MPAGTSGAPRTGGYARPMTLFARATQPLQRLDGPINRFHEMEVRDTPWMWWPASPPRRDRPYDAGQHAVVLVWSAVGFLAGDLLAQRVPEGRRSSGRRLRNERIATAVASAVVWVVAVGAWDRRAARLRRRRWRRAA